MQKNKEKKGFTLIEALIIVAILGILGTTLLITLTGPSDETTRKARSLNSARVRLEIEKMELQRKTQNEIATNIANSQKYTIQEKVIGSFDYLTRIAKTDNNPCNTTSGKIYAFLNSIKGSRGLSQSNNGELQNVSATSNNIYCLDTSATAGTDLNIYIRTNDGTWWCGSATQHRAEYNEGLPGAEYRINTGSSGKTIETDCRNETSASILLKEPIQD